MRNFISEYGKVIVCSLVVVLLITITVVLKPIAADEYHSIADLIHEFITGKLSSESPADYGIYLNDDGTANFVVKVNPGNVDETTAYAMVNGNQVMLSTLQKDGDDYIIPLPNIMPKQLNDQMTVTVYDGDGTPVSETISTTFADKLYEIIGTTSSKALKDFCKSFLNYGAYSQINFNYNTETLANNNLSESEKDVSDITYADVQDQKKTSSGETEGIIPYGMTLSVNNSGVKGWAWYSLSNGYSIDDYTFTIDGHKVTPEASGSLYKVGLERNNAPDLDNMVTIEVKYHDEGTSAMRISCFTYAEIVLKENDTSESGIKLSNFMRSMIKYNNAAKNLNNTLSAG